MKRYNPKEIEPKWQKTWQESGIYAAEDFSKKPKFVMLTEFPYPSGDGLHMGHMREYTLGDILARYKRMQGMNVLYPMGYDAFGLPTENYAIKNKIAPQIATDRNVANFQKQFESLGYSFDWNRSFKTTDPAYYKWTQWLFLQFYKTGLAYQDDISINWCPFCKTGLANEEVTNGRHERCDTLVEKKRLKQWLLKITEYADRLIDGLKSVDYPSRIAMQQINWIGRSEGAEISFELDMDLSGKDFVFLHAYGGKSTENFWPSLKEKIERRGGKVFAPDLPNTSQPNVEEQVQFVLNHYKFSTTTTVFGHSLGCVVAMKLLPKLDKAIKSLVLVAPPVRTEFKDNKPRPVLEEATDWIFDYEVICNKSDNITVLSDKNDHIVPSSHPIEIADKLHAQLIETEANGSHFTADHEEMVLEAIVPKLTVFTTRPDTLFGATFMVLSPEHPLVEQITTAEHKPAVGMYQMAAQAKSEIERQDMNRDKTGVFTGAYVINPINDEKLPIWIADYVLMGYGTGAIMAVPAHDERDNAFANKYDLPVKPVVTPVFEQKGFAADKKGSKDRYAVLSVAHDQATDKYCLIEWKADHFRAGLEWPGGGIDEGESFADAALREFTEETGYTDVTFEGPIPFAVSYYYKRPDGTPARNILQLAKLRLNSDDHNGIVGTEEYEKGMYEVLWLSKDEIIGRIDGMAESYQALTRAYFEGTVFSEQGLLIHSGKYDGLGSEQAQEEIVADLAAKGVAQKKTTYRLRDWIFSRQHYWGEPIPIIHCEKDGAVPVPADQLPVELPAVENYEPTDTGESPLAAIDEWVNTTCPECGGNARRETDTMPNWAGSSWYYLRYFDAKNDESFADKEKLDYWGGVDLYLGGMEHTTLHLLYSRFWHQFLYDQKLVPTPEPYLSRRGQGIILAADGSKMSKSKGNVVNPTEIIDAGYGADALRLAITFLAPYNQTTPWNPEAVGGTHRFLQRIWKLVEDYTNGLQYTAPDADGEDVTKLRRLTHQTIKTVTEDLDKMNFNTAIAALMQYTNELYKLAYQDKEVFSLDPVAWLESLRALVTMIAPFAPHMAEELWQWLASANELSPRTDAFDSVHVASWQYYDERYLESDSMTIVVQINGKLRAELEMSKSLSEDEVVEMARNDQKVATHLDGVVIRKVIYVPGRLVNFVIS